MFSVYPTPFFKRQFAKLFKRHASLKSDLLTLVESLKNQPQQGIHLGSGIFKIRMSITSKGKGKSGGARVITYLVTENQEVYLVFIYDKSQLENISKEQILELLKNVNLK
jgi:hypothetical protein